MSDSAEQDNDTKLLDETETEENVTFQSLVSNLQINVIQTCFDEKIRVCY